MSDAVQVKRELLKALILRNDDGHLLSLDDVYAVAKDQGFKVFGKATFKLHRLIGPDPDGFWVAVYKFKF